MIITHFHPGYLTKAWEALWLLQGLSKPHKKYTNQTRTVIEVMQEAHKSHLHIFWIVVYIKICYGIMQF